MATAFKLGTTSRNNAVNGIVDGIDAGTGAGRLEHRTGSPPTNVNDASSGTLLGTNTFNATAFGAASGGAASSNAITDDTSADASGEAGYFRVYAGAAGDTAALFQGSSGVSGDSPDLVFNNDVIVAGGTIAISSMTVTQPIGP